MKIALISDIHSNLEAFQAVMASLCRDHDIEKVMFLWSDIVGYRRLTPMNALTCCEALLIIISQGNHDYAAKWTKLIISYF